MGILMDIRYSLRLLRKSPGFSLLTLLVLTGGLTVSLFTFAFFYTMFYKPLPIKDGAGILRTAERIPLYEFTENRQKLTSFSDSGAWRDEQVRFSAEQDSQTLFGTYTEANLFTIAHTAPPLGRPLQPQDNAAAA